MADISVLARLLNGAMRNVDLTNNTPVVLSIKIGGGTNTELTKAILDRLVSLQNGTDVDATYHTHDGRYFTETELSDAVGPATGSDLIGDDASYSNFTPSAATVKGALEGIDSALAATADEKVGVSAADTTPGYLDDKLTAGSGLSKSIVNPGADETLDLSVNVDGSTLEINSDALRVKDAGITNAKVATGIDAVKIGAGAVSNTEFGYLDGVTSAIQTQLDAKVAKAGSSMDSAANITFSGGGEVLGLPSTPSSAGSAASKAYVDAVALGLAPKKGVRAATTGPGTLASSFEDGDVIDGITLATGDRILIKDQAAPAANGIYIVQASGAPVRSTDFDSLSPIDEINGAWVPVQFGTVNAGRVYVQYGVVATLGTDAINFEFYNPIAALIGGDMITVSGSTISVDLATVSGLESTNAGDAAGQLRTKLEASNPSLQINGSNELGAKLDGSGTITSGASGLKVGVDNSTIEINSNALRVKDAGITLAKLASLSVDENKLTTSVAGDGLAGGGGAALSVNVDGSTLEISADALRVKDAGITLAKLASLSVDENKLTASVAGAGLTGGAGSPLAVGANADGSIVVAADDIKVASSPLMRRSLVAGEAFAANTSFLVRWALTGETAGRIYKADKDASSSSKYMAIGMALSTGAVSAGGSITVIMIGEHTLGSSDTPFSSGDVGKELFVGASGAFILGAALANTANEAQFCVGVVQETSKIWMDMKQLRGIA